MQAATCPHCGRPWPFNGKNRYVEWIKDRFIAAASIIALIVSVGFFAPYFGGFIRLIMNPRSGVAVTEGELKEQIQMLIQDQFILTSIIGLLSGVLLLIAWLLLVFIWKRLSVILLKIEYKILCLAAWSQQEKFKSFEDHRIAPTQHLERRQHKLRWILATPFILWFISKL